MIHRITRYKTRVDIRVIHVSRQHIQFFFISAPGNSIQALEIRGIPPLDALVHHCVRQTRLSPPATHTHMHVFATQDGGVATRVRVAT